MVNPASHPALNRGRAAGNPRGCRRAAARQGPNGDRSGW
jgi:hypothetical protein